MSDYDKTGVAERVIAWMKLVWLVAFGLWVIVSLASAAHAVTIAIDENGNGIGTVGGGFLSNDPGPGGLANVLTYRLPFTGVQGDVLFGFEPGIIFGGDVLRFNGNGTVIFYSDNIDGFDSLADTSGPPAFLYANTFTTGPEIGSDSANSVVYTPQAGQPGFDPSFLPVYNFVSDGTVVPEASSLLLVSFGLSVLVGWRKWKRSGNAGC